MEFGGIGIGFQDGVTADFRGYTAGIWKDGTLQGSLLGFYTTSDNRAGWLSTYFDAPSGPLGSYYDGIKMWRSDLGVYTQELSLAGKTGLAIASGAPWYYDVRLAGQYRDDTGLRVGQILGQGSTGDRLFLTSDQGVLPYGLDRMLLTGPNVYAGRPETASGTASWPGVLGGVFTGDGSEWIAVGVFPDRAHR